MKEEPARRRGRINTIRQAAKLDAVLIQLSDELDELTHSAPEAIELPYNQRIARSQMRKRGGEARPIKATTAQLVGEHPLAASKLQRINLSSRSR